MRCVPIAGASFGATVTGVDLKNLDDAAWSEVEASFLDYGVLVFPGQHLSAQEQAAFGERFGDFESLTRIPGDGNSLSGFDITNERRHKDDGSLYSVGSRGLLAQIGNEGWHTDSTYTPVSSKAGLLSMQRTPSWGGGTGFADMRAAYDSLEPDTKSRIKDLWTYNSLHYSQARIGSFDLEGKGYGMNAGEVYQYPLVKTHPVTGRKALFVGRHSFGVPGMEAHESEKFLEELMVGAVEPTSGRVFEHQWAVGDIVVWDNRCILHRARPYDYTEVRHVRGTRIAGDATEGAIESIPSAMAQQVLVAETARVRAWWEQQQGPTPSPPSVRADDGDDDGNGSGGNTSNRRQIARHDEALFPRCFMPRAPVPLSAAL
jgi:alpha-ketoglutarate-dependent taurine dioxygenase